MARLAALAYALGFDRLADSYNLANTTPNIVYELLLGGVLSATLVPIFVEHREKGDDDATSAVVSVVGLALVLLTGLGIIVAPAVVKLYSLRLSGADAAAQQQVATDLLRMFMPQMLFYGITAVATALLNARRHFAAPAVTPVFNNLLVTAIFLALPHVARGHLTLEGVRHDPGTMLLLGLGTTAGVAAMALPLLPALRRAGIRLRLPLRRRPTPRAAAPTPGGPHLRAGQAHRGLPGAVARRASPLLPLPLRPAALLRPPRPPRAGRHQLLGAPTQRRRGGCART